MAWIHITLLPPFRNNIFKSQRYWARFVIILAVVVIIYVSSLNSKERKFARQREVLPFRFQPLRCQAKGDTFRGCTPKTCGRYVSDNLISDDEVKLLLSFAKSGFDLLDGAAEESAIFDLRGQLSNGRTEMDVRKEQTTEVIGQVFSHDHLMAVKLLKNRLLQSLADRFDVSRKSVHLAAPLFFSKLTNVSHLEYSAHRITKDTHPEVFYTTVVQLRDHGKDFKGGRMVFIDDPPNNKSITSVEARTGRILGYTSGRENLHYIEPVVVGTLYQLTFKFTCNEAASANDPWQDDLPPQV